MAGRSRTGRSREAERYKKAGTDALTLLDWCIEYFADNKQGRLAEKLARNRNNIHERLQ